MAQLKAEERREALARKGWAPLPKDIKGSYTCYKCGGRGQAGFWHGEKGEGDPIITTYDLKGATITLDEFDDLIDQGYLRVMNGTIEAARPSDMSEHEALLEKHREVIMVAQRGSIEDYNEAVLQATREGVAYDLVPVSDAAWAERVVALEKKLKVG